MKTYVARRARAGRGYPHREAPPVQDPRSRISLPAGPKDDRIKSYRWQKVAKAVLVRDRYICRIVVDCPTRATVADHIIPRYPGMPDSLFFGMGNLRAGCREHNLARGHVAKLERVVSGPTNVITTNYSRSNDAG